jgi:hypothetical protein
MCIYIGKHQFFGHLHENFGYAKSWNWIVLQFLVKCIQCLIWNKIFFFFLTILKLIFLCRNFAMFGVAKKWHWFFLIFSWENILVKSPYYEKVKKKKKWEYPHFFPTQEITPWKKNSLPLPIPHNKLLYFSLKPHIFKKNPLREEANLNILTLCFPHPTLFLKLTPKLIHSAYLSSFDPYTRSKGVPTMSM